MRIVGDVQRVVYGRSGAEKNWSWVVGVFCLFAFRKHCSFLMDRFSFHSLRELNLQS